MIASWVMLKVASDFLSAGNAILGKALLTHHVPDQRLYLFAVGLVSVPFAILGLPAIFTLRSPAHGIVVLLGGVLYTISGRFYYRAMAASQPFRLSLVLRLSPGITLVLSVVLIGEHLTLEQSLGFFITLVGGLALAASRQHDKKLITRGTSEAIVSVLTGSISSTLMLLLLSQYGVWATFTMTRIGVLLGMMIILGITGTWSAGCAFRQLRFLYQSGLLGEQLVRLLALFLAIQAVAQIQSAALVGVLSGFTPLYVWFIGRVTGQGGHLEGPISRHIAAVVLLLIGALLIGK